MFDPAFPNSVVPDNTRRCVAMTVPQAVARSWFQQRDVESAAQTGP
jgi:hypothetical protein